MIIQSAGINPPLCDIESELFSRFCSSVLSENTTRWKTSGDEVLIPYYIFYLSLNRACGFSKKESKNLIKILESRGLVSRYASIGLKIKKEVIENVNNEKIF